VGVVEELGSSALLAFRYAAAEVGSKIAHIAVAVPKDGSVSYERYIRLCGDLRTANIVQQENIRGKRRRSGPIQVWNSRICCLGHVTREDGEFMKAHVAAVFDIHQSRGILGKVWSGRDERRRTPGLVWSETDLLRVGLDGLQAADVCQAAPKGFSFALWRASDTIGPADKQPGARARSSFFWRLGAGKRKSSASVPRVLYFPHSSAITSACWLAASAGTPFFWRRGAARWELSASLPRLLFLPLRSAVLGLAGADKSGPPSLANSASSSRARSSSPCFSSSSC
jgi:hypothetical protein